MNMKLASILAVAILVISQLESSDAAATLAKAGYKFLGTLGETGGLRAVTTSYFVSDDVTTAVDAVTSCQEDFSGQLVTPLNSIQIGYIRQALDAAGQLTGERFWTAGQYTVSNVWWWRTSDRAISSVALKGNFATGFDDSSHPTGRCLTLVGTLGNFGFANDALSACIKNNRYICEVKA